MTWKPVPIADGSYADESRPYSAQDTVNYILEYAEQQGTRSQAKLRGAPGWGDPFCDLATAAPIRGARNVEGVFLVISSNKLFQINPDGTSVQRGIIPGVGRCSLAHNQITGGNEVAISNGQSGYVYNTVSQSLQQITDEAFIGAKCFDYVDQYIVGVEPAGRFAFTSDLANAMSYSSLDRYEAEGSPDKIVGQIVTHREWWLMGQRTIEPYQNTGATTNTFQRSQGLVIERGLASAFAVAELDNSVFWLGDDGIVYRAGGYTPQRISTLPIEQDIGTRQMSLAFAMTYEDQGHKIFYLTFPDGLTWGYDVVTKKWHRRESRGLNRWRINTLTNWNGGWYAGDFSNGRIYLLDWNVQRENDEQLVRRRVTGVLHGEQNRIGVHGVAVVIDTGVKRPPLVSRVNPSPVLRASGDLGNGNVGDFVSFAYTVTSNRRPVTASLLSGALPSGLTMDSSGIITGNRITPGIFTWTVRFTDATGAHVDVVDGCTTYGLFVLDPASKTIIGNGGTLSADGLTLTKNAESGGFSVDACMFFAGKMTSGKFYIEYTCVVAPDRAEDRGGYFGVLRASGNHPPGNAAGYGVFDMQSDTSAGVNGALVHGQGPRFSNAGQTVGIAVDVASGKVWWRDAAGWNAGGDPASGSTPFGTISPANLSGGIVPYATTYTTNGKCTVNFGQHPFLLGPVPAGFKAGWGIFP